MKMRQGKNGYPLPSLKWRAGRCDRGGEIDYIDNRFKEGDEVNGLFWNDGQVKVGENSIEKITVVMEDGQMNGVPWFATWKNGKIVAKYNGAMLEGVEL